MWGFGRRTGRSQKMNSTCWYIFQMKKRAKAACPALPVTTAPVTAPEICRFPNCLRCTMSIKSPAAAFLPQWPFPVCQKNVSPQLVWDAAAVSRYVRSGLKYPRPWLTFAHFWVSEPAKKIALHVSRRMFLNRPAIANRRGNKGGFSGCNITRFVGRKIFI